MISKKNNSIIYSVIIAIFFISTSITAKLVEPVLVLDSSGTGLPKQFRSTTDASSLPVSISKVGLQTLNAIGSSQFSESELEAVLRTTKTTPIIVDLRQESHGFIAGNAISWYAPRDWGNLGKSPEQVERDQQARLTALLSSKTIRTSKIVAKGEDGSLHLAPMTLQVKQVKSEEDLAESHHLNYLRIYVTDGMQPQDDQVDRFVQFANKLPPDASVYFHCRAGKGRTTTFMSMFDMLRNSKQVSLNDILKRQQALGGINLLKEPKPTSYKYNLAKERIAFLKEFYQYSRSNTDDFKTTWSQWKTRRN